MSSWFPDRSRTWLLWSVVAAIAFFVAGAADADDCQNCSCYVTQTWSSDAGGHIYGMRKDAGTNQGNYATAQSSINVTTSVTCGAPNLTETGLADYREYLYTTSTAARTCVPNPVNTKTAYSGWSITPEPSTLAFTISNETYVKLKVCTSDS